MKARIQVVIADDHAIVREGLRILLRSRPQFALVGEANDGLAALALTAELRPDVLVLDLKMPLLDGVGVLRAMARQAPGVRTLVFTIDAVGRSGARKQRCQGLDVGWLHRLTR